MTPSGPAPSGPALLDGRVAVVTGAARGIGRTVAERYLWHEYGDSMLFLP